MTSGKPETLSLSVIICTYNRADSLRHTLESFRQLEIPSTLSWELIVVNNNSSDHTHDVCAEFIGKLPLRCISESRQGLSFARNHGFREAKGELVAFTDDDVEVDKRWLSELWQAANRHPEAGFFGGRILPRWNATPPQWVQQHSAGLLKGVTLHYDLGDAEVWVPRENTPMFFGANMAFRRALIDGDAPCDEALGRRGAQLVHGEETAVMQRLAQKGHPGLYVPNALVHHCNRAERMTERHVREWFAGYGVTRVRRNEVRPGFLCGGVPVRFVRRAIQHAVKFALVRWTCPSRVWLRAETKMAEAIGIVRETRRRALQKQ